MGVIMSGICPERRGSHQLQGRQLLGHTLDLSVALLAHIFYLLGDKVKQLKYGHWPQGAGSIIALHFCVLEAVAFIPPKVHAETENRLKVRS